MSGRTAMTIVLAAAALLASLALATPARAAHHAAADSSATPKLESLNPALASHPYALADGPRPYASRLSLSPGYGWFGSDKLFVLRAAFAPSQHFSYEASIAHNPSPGVHALLHSVSVLARMPRPGRLQPYLTAGYGMIVVFPGRAIAAAPVTKNTLAAGGGLECFIRDDLALRAEMRHVTVFGQQRGRDGVVAYPYSQGTIGLAFYRSLEP